MSGMPRRPGGTAARRPGPRPLPHHLALAAATWTGSCVALTGSNGGWSGWKGWSPAVRPSLEALRAALEGVAPEAFAAAVEDEAQRRLAAFLGAIEAYRRHPYRRDLAEPPTVWQQGVVRLLDYGSGGRGRPLLVVPSLVNRAYILDLAPGRSLLRWLAAEGFRPYLVDWGTPGAAERGFGLGDYVADCLEPALDAVRQATRRRPALLGYCMGGLLALALAARRPRHVAAIACLAAPWDFHAGQPERARLTAALGAALEPVLAALGELPVDLIQILFAGLDPFLVIRKFLAFAALDPASPAAEAFVALEDWANDGVPLAAPVARECFTDWYGANAPARGAWTVAGRRVEPGRLALPALVVVPHRDRIVPPGSAEALLASLPRATALRPDAGHIGMVVGGAAPARVWRPLAVWLAGL